MTTWNEDRQLAEERAADERAAVDKREKAAAAQARTEDLELAEKKRRAENARLRVEQVAAGCTCPPRGNPHWPHRHGCPMGGVDPTLNASKITSGECGCVCHKCAEPSGLQHCGQYPCLLAGQPSQSLPDETESAAGVQTPDKFFALPGGAAGVHDIHISSADLGSMSTAAWQGPGHYQAQWGAGTNRHDATIYAETREELHVKALECFYKQARREFEQEVVAHLPVEPELPHDRHNRRIGAAMGLVNRDGTTTALYGCNQCHASLGAVAALTGRCAECSRQVGDLQFMALREMYGVQGNVSELRPSPPEKPWQPSLGTERRMPVALQVLVAVLLIAAVLAVAAAVLMDVTHYGSFAG